MKILASRIPGVFLIEPAVIEDDRGWFAELFQQTALAEHGLASGFVRSALSFNRRAGTLRGLHFQRAPHEDAKLVTCVTGSLFDVVADIRTGSPSFGQWQSFELSVSNHRAILLPVGVAHGFQTLADDTTVLYHIAAYYVPESGNGIRWDDPTLAITWPKPPRVISDQDLRWGFLSS